MHGHKFILTLTILIFISLNAFSQVNYQSEYLSGKAFFKSGNYQRAQNHFEKLLVATEKNPFYLYASYFYGISAYHSGDTTKGMEQLRKIKVTHSEWKNRDEVNLWYGKMLLETGDLFKGLSVLNETENEELYPLVNKIKKAYLPKYDSIPMLQKAIELYPYDSIVAKQLAQKISNQSLVDRKVELLEFLIDSFKLNQSDFDFVDESVSQKKDTYNVAVLFPFLMDDLTTNKGSKGNQFVLDIYQAIQLAADEFNEADGPTIKLFAYDTKMDSATTLDIIESGELLEMDLVIGPFYPAPGNLVRAYSAKNRINMVNPLSTNSLIIGTNPYSFLLKSTPETRARKAAAYAKANFENKNATIFYGDKLQDSLFAYTYKEILEKDSFNITWIAASRSSVASTEILRTLTEVVDTDTIKTRDKVYISNTVKVKVGEEDSLVMSRDTIGHIMLASANNLLVSNVLSAIDTRRDSVPIIGWDDWMDLSQISFDQLQRMKVVMIGQNYFDFTSADVVEFKENYKEKYNQLPSKYSYDGYEVMKFFGNQLIEYGNYFQHGLYDAGFQDGFLYHGFDYTNANDNQFVPIMRLEDLELKMLNEEQKVLEEEDSSEFIEE